jgi:hypothetical protein
MAGTDIRKKYRAKATFRGSQVIFGERQHLQEVLRSVQSSRLPLGRKQAEIRKLEQLTRVRTEELNRINPAWDRKFKKAHNPSTSSKELLRLVASLSREDYLLARVLTEHKDAPGELLAQLSNHPYSAVRENVARHPGTPAEVLRRLAEDSNEPLWFLVACNPSTPTDLSQRLRARMMAVASQ